MPNKFSQTPGRNHNLPRISKPKLTGGYRKRSLKSRDMSKNVTIFPQILLTKLTVVCPTAPSRGTILPGRKAEPSLQATSYRRSGRSVLFQTPRWSFPGVSRLETCVPSSSEMSIFATKFHQMLVHDEKCLVQANSVHMIAGDARPGPKCSSNNV